MVPPGSFEGPTIANNFELSPQGAEAGNTHCEIANC